MMAEATGFVEDGMMLSHECYQHKCCDDPDPGDDDPCAENDCSECSQQYRIVVPSGVTFDYAQANIADPVLSQLEIPLLKDGLVSSCLWRNLGSGTLFSDPGPPSVSVALSGAFVQLQCAQSSQTLGCFVESDSGWEGWFLELAFASSVSGFSTFVSNVSAYYCAPSSSRLCPIGAYQLDSVIISNPPFFGGIASATFPDIITVENI